MNLMTTIPPSPPQSTDGSTLQEDFFEGRQVYPPVYRVMNMSSNEINGNTAHGIVSPLFWALFANILTSHSDMALLHLLAPTVSLPLSPLKW
jgi:hypothetical protein